MMNRKTGNHGVRGYTLVEVLVGILIFAIGMMALAQLQGHLARNSGDASARVVATNIAEGVIERARTFSQLDAAVGKQTYADIRNGTGQVTVGGVTYDITSQVTNYYYDPDSETFTTTAPVGAPWGDFKLLEVTVSWNGSQEFQIDQTQQTQGRLGSGSIKLSDVISSIATPSGGKVALGNIGTNLYSPPVDYNPGQNPDIVSIQLGQNKFKESTTPEPDVIRQDELVETKFDVVTYSQNTNGATFLRREEFRAVSCDCTLHVPNSNTDGGLRPTIWEGSEYSEGEFVSKPYGTSANNQQSRYCTICCRDHHDGGTGTNDDPNDPGRSRYNPFRSSTDYYDSTFGALAGDHKHYNRDRQGNLVLAENDGDAYVEACRMVRKDGFFRIAQDLRQEGLNSFPADYLDDDSEVSEYSGYVTGAVSAFEAAIGATNGYETNPPTLPAPSAMSPPVTFPASSFSLATSLPTATGATEQQLRSRGIYIDYLSDKLRTKINCLDLGGSGENCGVPDVTSALEIIPFYDVQLTWLSRWNETPVNNPVDVTNEPILTGNAHSRGVADLTDGFGFSTVNAEVHRGNLGLTGTDPVDPRYAGELRAYNLYALAQDPNTPPALSDIVISGNITSGVPGVKAADAVVTSNDAQCARTNTGYQCTLLVGISNPRMTISNYAKKNRVLVACSSVLSIQGSDTSSNPWTRFNLPLTSRSGADIWITENGCP